jgi:hypothetical protein
MEGTRLEYDEKGPEYNEKNFKERDSRKEYRRDLNAKKGTSTERYEQGGNRLEYEAIYRKETRLPKGLRKRAGMGSNMNERDRNRKKRIRK